MARSTKISWPNRSGAPIIRTAKSTHFGANCADQDLDLCIQPARVACRSDTLARKDAGNRDRLSDALHERLTKRFVDRRTSVAHERLRENAMLEAEISVNGDVFVVGDTCGSASPVSGSQLARAARERTRRPFRVPPIRRSRWNSKRAPLVSMRPAMATWLCRRTVLSVGSAIRSRGSRRATTSCVPRHPACRRSASG